MRSGIFQFFVWGLRSREPQKKCGRNVAFFVWEEAFGKNPEEWQKNIGNLSFASNSRFL